MAEYLYGAVNDQDESLAGKGGNWGKFGLNPQGKTTKFEFNPNGGKDGVAANCVDIHVVGENPENEFFLRIFEPTEVYNSKKVLVGPSDPEFPALFKAEQAQRTAVIVHAAKALGVTQAQIDAALATPVKSYKEFADIIIGLLPANWKTVPIDFFLEYQWEISEGNDKTYLQLPKNMKGGYFLCPHIPGTFVEVRSATGLQYVDNTARINHLFTRSANYMESNKAIQQGAGASGATAGKFQPAANGEAPKKTSW